MADEGELEYVHCAYKVGITYKHADHTHNQNWVKLMPTDSK